MKYIMLVLMLSSGCVDMPQNYDNFDCESALYCRINLECAPIKFDEEFGDLDSCEVQINDIIWEVINTSDDFERCMKAAKAFFQCSNKPMLMQLSHDLEVPGTLLSF